MLPMRGTRFVIQERSPDTTSVGQRGHGGACAAISLHATITAARRPLPAKPAVRPLDEVLARLLLEEVARGREERSVREARVDRLVGARERDIGARAVGALIRDLGRDVHRGVEQDGALDAVGVAGRELRDQLAAEAVTDPGPARDPSASAVSTRSATCCSTLQGGSQPERP